MGAIASKKKEYKVSEKAESSGNLNPAGNSSMDDVIEAVVCKEGDLKDGSMQVFDVGEDGSVLIVKENGAFSALGTKCTHYGAPLIKGVLCNGKLRCPWHGACFNSKTGDIEDFPGLDSLPTYQVLLDNGDVKVRASKAQLKVNKRVKKMSKRAADDQRTFVVVGGGGSGQACIETLRQEGFTGQIILISRERFLPYDRPKLSKALSAKGEEISLRSEDFYKSSDIDVWLQKEVTSVDSATKTLTCSDGSSIGYNSLMLATGGRPLTLDIPGADLKNVCVLRTPDDANYIAEQAKGKNAVVLGTSFIGMEVAAFLTDKANSVVVIGRSDVPFRVVLGELLGRRLQKLHEEKGVTFYMNSDTTEFVGKDGILTEVVLSSGERLPADICILGVGVRPATEFLKNSGIPMNSAGQVLVNEFLQSEVEDVFAGGDIVNFPLTIMEDEKVNIGHWQMAHSHGHIAALNMLGKNKKHRSVPFFWCMLYGKSLRYAGYAKQFDDIIIDGALEELKFVAYYTLNNKVVAVATLNSDPVAAQFASLLYMGESLSKDDVRSNPTAWFERVDCSKD